MRRSREDPFCGLTDPWAHGRLSQYAFPVTVMIGAWVNFSFLSELV